MDESTSSKIVKYSNLFNIELIFFSIIAVGIGIMAFYNINLKIVTFNEIITLLIQIISIIFALTGIGYFYIFRKIDEYKNKFLTEFQETIFLIIDNHRDGFLNI